MRNPIARPALALLFLASALGAQGVTSPEIPYQGRLVQNGTPATGTHQFLFTLLDGSGNLIYSSGTVPVIVNSGLYSVVLGDASMKPIPATVAATSNVQLAVTIDGNAMSPNTALVPEFQSQYVIGAFAGDVTGTQGALTVGALEGMPLDFKTVAPASGNALIYNGKSWAPGTAVGPAGPAGPAGATGAAGIQGPAGPASATVLVNAVPTLVTLANDANTPLSFGTQTPLTGQTTSPLSASTFTAPASSFYQFSLCVSTANTPNAGTGGNPNTYPNTLQAGMVMTTGGHTATLLGPAAQYNANTAGTNTLLTAYLSYTGYLNMNDTVTFSAFFQGVAQPMEAPSNLTVIAF